MDCVELFWVPSVLVQKLEASICCFALYFSVHQRGSKGIASFAGMVKSDRNA